jgi:2-keto-3-deoxy-L-fuconate dehydrogenase
VAVDVLVAAAVDAHGGLDVMVANAGVQVEKTVADTTDADFDLVMDVNVRGVFHCCRAAVRHMRDHGGGSIVNIGSVAGDTADHGMAVYNASKGAVHSLTRSVAVDHGRDGVRCNAIRPGWIATEMAEVVFDGADDPAAMRADAVGAHPVGRLGSPGDVAALAVWLASDESTFVSGSLFTVDGGLTAQSPIGG